MQPISACTSVYDASKGFLLSPCNQSLPVPVFMMHLRDFCSLHATISACTSVYDAPKGFLLSPSISACTSVYDAPK